jgi:3-phenylpropionate/cinnamic acid dioxygenase small subunit
MARATVPVELRLEIADFLAREAELLDERQFTAWLALFADDARYAVRLREPPQPPAARDSRGGEDGDSSQGTQTPSPNPRDARSIPRPTPQGAGASDAASHRLPPSPSRGEGGLGGIGVGPSLLFEDDKAFLALRVRRLETRLAHAERPPSATRHIYTNLLIARPEGEVDDEVEVQASFVVYQGRPGLADQLFFGKRRDLLRQVAGEWRIARRLVTLDQNPLPRTLTIFF